jgi:hypothetical protein
VKKRLDYVTSIATAPSIPPIRPAAKLRAEVEENFKISTNTWSNDLKPNAQIHTEY